MPRSLSSRPAAGARAGWFGVEDFDRVGDAPGEGGRVVASLEDQGEAVFATLLRDGDRDPRELLKSGVRNTHSPERVMDVRVIPSRDKEKVGLEGDNRGDEHGPQLVKVDGVVRPCRQRDIECVSLAVSVAGFCRGAGSRIERCAVKVAEHDIAPLVESVLRTISVVNFPVDAVDNVKT